MQQPVYPEAPAAFAFEPRPAEAPAVTAYRALPFTFTGSASEYFRIWIVNTLLSIVTLGVYSAWAKVRNKQYFYRHTWVDGSSFEYLADPIAILKGRIIIVIALGLFVAAQYYSLPLYIALLVASLAVTPWVVVKAMTFNARNSAFRNVRFAFGARMGEAFKLYFGLVGLYLISCGVAYPYSQWRFTKFLATGHRYGRQPLTWNAQANDYFIAYLVGFALILPAYLLFFGAGFGLAMASAGAEAAADAHAQQAAMTAWLPLLLVPLYAYMLVPAAYLRAKLANLFYGGLAVGYHRLRSTQRMKDVLFLYATNALAVILTLGLMIPWAQIRLARYRAQNLTLFAWGDLHTLVGADAQGAGALGDAATDLGDMGIDVSL